MLVRSAKDSIMVLYEIWDEAIREWRHTHICMKSLDRWLSRHIRDRTPHSKPVWVEGEIIDRGVVLITKRLMERVLKEE